MSLHFNKICTEKTVTAPINAINNEPKIKPKYLIITGIPRIPAPFMVLVICNPATK